MAYMNPKPYGESEGQSMEYSDISDRCSYKIRQDVTVLLSRNIVAAVGGSSGGGRG